MTRLFGPVAAWLVGVAVVLGAVVMVALFSLNGYPLSPRFWVPSPRFTAAGVESVALGDSRAHVVELLGAPTADEGATLVYARAGIVPPACPKVWVYFDAADRVREVYAKSKQWCLGDAVAYGLTESHRWKQGKLLADFFN